MGKGNPLMNQLRGKVGGMVFTRLAGEQVVRARNTQPKNPQTTKQMAQRAAMATCVEFFTRGKKNLFKFAFENKRPGESDYNAFVRANIKTIPVQSKKTLDENGPIFGEIVLSQGSLPQPAFVFDEDHEFGALGVTALPVQPQNLTVGMLSQAIIEKNGLMNGDIITVVAIAAPGTSCVENEADAEAVKALTVGEYVSRWIILQFTLDTASTELASTLSVFDFSDVDVDSVYVPFNEDILQNQSYNAGGVAMLGVIASRPTVTGLKVSSSSMAVSANTAIGVTIGTSDAWKIWVARNWNTASSLDVQPENILEGSLSEN